MVGRAEGGEGGQSLPAADGSGEDDSASEGSATDASEGGDAESLDSGSSVDAGCQPGVARCQGNFGYQMCQDDGTWGPPASCEGYSSNGTSSYCVTIDGWGYCVDPACWYWASRGLVASGPAVGVCDAAGGFQRCTSGGTLSPEACEAGCTQVGLLDGETLGVCRPLCVEGARECLGGALYRQCAGGKWSDTPSACPTGQVCNPLATGALPQIQCGASCDPGTSRCAADAGGVEMCTSGGQWVSEHACLLGRCIQGGQQAQCQAECAVGENQCAYDGAGTQRTCGDAGLWNPESTCEAGSRCRISGATSVGCVACLGSAPGGGNAYGGIDSQCQGSQLSTCGHDNQWSPPAPCGDGGTCVEVRSGPSAVASCAY
jgi:hypothetical protein